MAMETLTPPLYFFFQSLSDDLEDDSGYIEFDDEEEIEYDPTMKEFNQKARERACELARDVSEAFNRVKYGMKIGNWIVICNNFEFYNNTKEPGSIPHIWLLIKLEKLLSIVDNDDNIKDNMSARNVDAFDSTKEIIINELKQYHSQIVSFKKTLKKKPRRPRVRGFYEDSDDEVEMQAKDDEEDERSSHWVTGELEIRWKFIEKKMREIYYERKPPYSLDDINKLTSLAEWATTPAQKVRIFLNVVHATFTLNENLCGHIPVQAWGGCVLYMIEVVGILGRHRNIVLESESGVGGCYFRNETKKNHFYKGKIRVGDGLIRIISRICFEFHSIMRLGVYDIGEYGVMLFELCRNLMMYLQTKGDVKTSTHVALLLMGVMYFKTQEEYELICKGGRYLLLKYEMMDEMFNLIQLEGGQIIRAQAAVFQIYHHAIIDQFEIGEKLLLKSRLHLEVHNMDLAFIAYYKEALKQLGLCGFRNGRIEEAHTCLCDRLYAANSKEEELHSKKTSDMKIRHGEMLPYDKNIDHELLKVVHVICAMLLDKKILSKKCLVKLKVESKSLKSDNIIIESLRSWIHLKGRSSTLEMLKMKIQKEAFTFTSFNLEKLSAMFGPSKADTHKNSSSVDQTPQHYKNPLNEE